MKIIRHWLKIYDREFFSYYKYIVTILLLIPAFLLRKQYGIMLLFLGGSFHAYGIAMIPKKYQMKTFLQLSAYPPFKQNLYSFLAVIARNFIFIFAYFLYFKLETKYNIVFLICFSLLLYIYNTLFGILIGKIISYYYLGLILLVLFTILYLAAYTGFHHTYLRFISPLVQAYSPSQIYLLNIVRLLIICIFLGGICFWAFGNFEKTICLLIAMIAMMFCLLQYEKNYVFWEQSNNSSFSYVFSSHVYTIDRELL